MGPSKDQAISQRLTQDESPNRLGASFRSQVGSFSASGPLAREAIARDLEEQAEDELSRSSSGESDTSTIRQSEFSMLNSYVRPTYVNPGNRSTADAAASVPKQGYLSKREREAVRSEERSLLRDNLVIPPKHPRRQSEGGLSTRLAKKLSISALRRVRSAQDEEAAIDGEEDETPSENTALLGGDPERPYGGLDSPQTISKRWEEAVAAGKIHTTYRRELKTLSRYSGPLILTFVLQYSLTVTSIFVVGHIGKIELGAVSLATMTANITGYAVYQGLATSLDTLCAQAYGSGRKKLVGLQLQRMVYFLWLITIPVAIIWLSGTAILSAIVPEKETARLAGLYLKILLAGAPGYAAFESGKRFVQAQGLFSATLYVLLICAPLNVFLNWLLVWHYQLGFIGAPIAVSITEMLLPLLLLLYVRFVAGRECWGGFERRALRNWGPMIKLALPGLIMVLAEFLAFEILTLTSSWIGATELAAQSILSTITALTYQIPFPVSIAASTRIANFIGATLHEPAKMAAKVTMFVAVIVGLLNVTLLSSLRTFIPQAFTQDPDVIKVVGDLLPLCAAFQLFDAAATCCNGILRGLGRQEVGGIVNLFAYYVIAMPISFGTGFGLHWELYGLWSGPALALGIVAAIEGTFIYRTSWEAAVEAAHKRNTAG